MKAYRNSEHYSDPTAGKALDNIMQERQEEVKKLICELRRVAGLSGFSIACRIVLMDKITGKIYR